MGDKRMQSFTAGIIVLAILALLNACGSNDGTNTTTPTVPLTVSATYPAANATGVALNSAVTATFNSAMNPATITTSTFIVSSAGGQLSGTVTLSGRTATFTPAASLPANTQFTATITSDVRDLTGNSLQSSYNWRFSTGSAVDTTPPAAISTSPANSATNVARNTDITVTFNEPMAAASINGTTFTLATTTAGTPVAGIVTPSEAIASFVPTTPLAASTSYTATISNGAKDLAGNFLPGAFSFSFTTGSGQDVLPPAVLSSSPASNATGVSVATTVSVTFSEAMNPATITPGSFILASSAGTVSGSVALNGDVATFTPTALLTGNTVYTATITTSATDQAGNHLTSIHTFNFTTGPEPVILATEPANNATNIPWLSPTISATFSKAMNPASLTPTTFTVSCTALGARAGNVTSSGTTAQFIPLTGLAPNSICTATITTGAADLAGNHLLTNYSWSFATGQ
jgi:hypothetical protein